MSIIDNDFKKERKRKKKQKINKSLYFLSVKVLSTAVQIGDP